MWLRLTLLSPLVAVVNCQELYRSLWSLWESISAFGIITWRLENMFTGFGGALLKLVRAEA